jgi:hypothetical protein
MHAELQRQAAFYLTGKAPGAKPAAGARTALRPALLAAYRDLSRLRYDFPAVLLDRTGDGAFVESLSDLIDRALDAPAASGAPAGEGDRLRLHARRLEREVRVLAAGGTQGTLGTLLDAAAARLSPAPDAHLAASVARLKAALPADAQVLDCDGAAPARLVTHAWRTVQAAKAAAFGSHLDRLILKLGEILRADFARSEAGRTPASLRAAVGGTFGDAFDFEAMSRVLGRVHTESALTEARRTRIEATLGVLQSQRFYAGRSTRPYEFRFESCAGALAAYRERMPAMLELTRAITAAEMEIEGELSGPRHDALLGQLAESRLDARDLALFPDYVVCVNANDLHTTQYGELMEILAGGLPVKLLVQDDDLLELPPDDATNLAFGARSPQLAQMATALGDVFVLQSAGSHLLRCRDRLMAALRHPGPALISVFSGATPTSLLPPYLNAAAAMESRAFPAFTRDPAAARGPLSRFALDGNPQADRDWPVHAFAYEDGAHQRASEDLAFTFADFVACDRRHAARFAAAPAQSATRLAPVAECIDLDTGSLPDRLPSVAMVGDDDVLQRMLVDARLVREARRCRDAWRNLQELGGMRGPRAPVETAPAPAPVDVKQPAAAPVAAAAAPAAPKPAAPAPAEAADAATEHGSDEPYIETVRCSSCNECITLNGKMFAYDANQQAYIADPDAGTYRELVEAAESCQVAVIHPGKPRNPNEPGLEELLKRAEPFR